MGMLMVIAGILLSACLQQESPLTTVTTAESSPERRFLMESLQGLPRAGDELEPGQSYRYEFYIHCGMRYLRPVPDNRNWETTNPPFETGRYPDSWRPAFSNPRESISPTLLGTVELVTDDVLEFRVPGFDVLVVYTPTTAQIPECA